MWLHRNARLGVVTTDFVDESTIWESCLWHMMVPMPPGPPPMEASLGATTVDGGRPYVFMRSSNGYL